MCGIAGVLLNSPDRVSEELLTRMGMAQSHRGPDSFAVYSKDRFGVAHNRLSILDLSPAGNQPFKDGSSVLVYNGEIYNYLSLKRDLAQEGVEVSGTSDTAVLFACLVHWGVPKTLQMIRGMFAFAFYDADKETVYLCRDRLGIKPLFWLYDAAGLYWASEVKSLAAGVTIKVDSIQTLFSLASIGEKLNETTVFEHVRHVPPGHFLCFQAGGASPQLTSYYDILEDIDEAYYRELDKMSKPVLLDCFQKILSDSVQGMLMSDAPMGIFVSGGIDSSLIASIATNYDNNLSLFTANVTGQYTEFPDAQLLASHLKKQLYDAKFEPEMLLSHWAMATYHYETPIVIHTNAVPFSRVAALAHSKGVKAVLTGEGADELFLGYPTLLTRRLNGIAKMPVELLKSAYEVVPGLREYLFPNEKQTISGFMDLLVQGFDRQRLREKGYEAYSFLSKKLIEDQYLSIQMIREGLIALLFRNDRMGMLASIESRFPFLDESMIRFAINLPMKWKIAHTSRFHNYKHPFLMDKAVVRWTAEYLLPPQLAYKKKNGFPMYGYKHVRVSPGFFRDGYVAQLVGLTDEKEAYMLRTQPPYYVAKLAAVEIFGRLFAWGQTPDDVTRHLLRTVNIVNM